MDNRIEELVEKADEAKDAFEKAIEHKQDIDARDALICAADLIRGLAELSKSVFAAQNGFVARFDAYTYPSLLEAANLLEGSANELVD